MKQLGNNSLTGHALNRGKHPANSVWRPALDIIIGPKRISAPLVGNTSRAKTWVTETNSVAYHFNEGEYVFLRCEENIVEILRSMGVQISGKVEIHFDDREISPPTRCVLKFQLSDLDGSRLPDVRIALGKGIKYFVIDRFDQLSSLYFRFGLEGSGRFGHMALEVKECIDHSGTTGATQLDGVSANAQQFDTDTAPLNLRLSKNARTDVDGNTDFRKVEDPIILMKNKNYQAALAVAQELPQNRTKIRLLSRIYLALRMFREVIDTYNSSDEQLRNEASMKLRFIEACANLGEIDSVKRIFSDALLSLSADRQDFLVQAYRYAGLLDDKFRKFVRAKAIIATIDREKNFSKLLRCGHDFLSDGDHTAFCQFLDKIGGMTLSDAQIIKYELLASQFQFYLGNFAEQANHFNSVLAKQDLLPVSIKDSLQAFAPNNIVSSNKVARSVRGPVVTVLMTSFNSEETINYAIESVLNQTYADIELIICDDCSNDASISIVKQYAASDKRIKIVEMPINGGTYRAKNRGLALADGEYVTCQDSDDWAHPQKIEQLVNKLDSSSYIGSIVSHVRLSESKGIQCKSEYIRPDFSSLMYRRLPVLSKLGFYDSVRAGADSEMQCRIERVFGSDSITLSGKLLSFVALSPSSLSGGGAFAMDEDAGIFSGVRNSYRRNFLRWHEESKTLYIDEDTAKRPFEAPSVLI